jgi:hypothetical protein
MKRFTSVAVAVSLAIGAASTSWAGQEIYVGVVDQDDQMNTYYLEPKLWAWLHSEYTHDDKWRWDADPVWDDDFDPQGDDKDEAAEEFKTSFGVVTGHAPVCITPQEVTNGDGINGANNELVWDGELEPTARLIHDNSGWYRWRINLPKKPEGNINIVVQCGILKPNSWSPLVPNAIQDCAGETGEFLGQGVCTRRSDPANVQIVDLPTLPTVEAIAFPDPTRGEPFHLTSFKTPSYYALGFKTDAAGEKSLKPIQSSHVILNGKREARISLKACQPETMYVKIPVTGQVNGMNETETALEAGEEIQVTLRFPEGHPMDVYCDKYSVKITGLGNPGTQAGVEDEI